MNKIIKATLLTLIVNPCFASNFCKILDTIPNKHTKAYEAPLFEIRKKNTDSVLKNYADSINHYPKGPIPAFLFNECFDYYRYLWKGMHSPVSLRWKVLEKVHNKKALKLILDSQDIRLKKKCNYPVEPYPNIVVPMIEKSFYELVEKRYLQLAVSHKRRHGLDKRVINRLAQCPCGDVAGKKKNDHN